MFHLRWQEYCKTAVADFKSRASLNGIRMTRNLTIVARLVIMTTALAFAVPAMCSGQDAVDPSRLEIDRAELTRLLTQYDAVAMSTAYSDALREEGRAQASTIRERLSVGDFRAGDQIGVIIEGAGAVQSDTLTLTVEAGPLIDVPSLGPIPLEGVLRSELETHLGKEFGRFLQSPRVQAHALIRVSVMGVAQPGFYMIPADLPLSEAVMLAGGPGLGADPGQIRVERGADVLWSVEELLAPVAAGGTLDDLGLRAGDRIILREGSAPGAGPDASTVLRSTVLVAIPALLISLLRR